MKRPIEVVRAVKLVAIALRRYLRESQKIELLRFRRQWAEKHYEYECVGGPYDGEVRPCAPRAIYVLARGYYEIDLSDCRLHFHQRATAGSGA